ncbi:unnamed protein product [Parascedosporium putredinis]|uniref:Uncharacterized protein n=1 Tax=Parascedosporium putredinis TaxID=1442378 RepID=A0A9P1GZC8_9PEZI|nr:unnamed protein product [Parascedosporium putredinis]CAI7990696.1 unnamed protein product [Parascedosporium putredinis]
MENPWSSPWTTVDDDQSKRQALEHTAAPVSAAKFGSVWDDNSFGDWASTDLNNGDDGALTTTDERDAGGIGSKGADFGYTTAPGIASPRFTSFSHDRTPCFPSPSATGSVIFNEDEDSKDPEESSEAESSRPSSPYPESDAGPAEETLVIPKHRDASPTQQGDQSRQASRVQELVVMYDGIAKKATHEPLPRYPHLRSQKTPRVTTTVKMMMAKIATLFEGVAEEPDVRPADLPDHPDLNFSTVSERKAWYHLSRQGSSRLHDFGDDDNYSRVTWRGSAVSEETFVIVRRWMQEGPALAGARRDGTGGWRPPAATMPATNPSSDAKPQTSAREDGGDDDEEWGDMVSSPQTSNGWGWGSTSMPDSGVDFAVSSSTKATSVASPDGSVRSSHPKPSVRFAEPPLVVGPTSDAPAFFPSSPASHPASPLSHTSQRCQPARSLSRRAWGSQRTT